MKETAVVYIGIDVSKDALDIDAGIPGVTRIGNTPAEIRKALKAAARRVPPGKALHACFESTGRYHATLVAECQRAGVRHSVLNPRKVACFAKSVAHAKTDAVDACLIRRYAEARIPEPAPPPDKAAAKLGTLLALREAIVKANVALKAALGTAGGAAAKPVRKAVACNEGQIAEYGRLIAEAVRADAETAGLVDALCAVKGVGELTAAKVAAWMPEIGTLGRRRAAALAGLAPHTRESGKWKGRSRIGGGRKGVRDALFMPATVARCHDPHMRRAYEGLIARGKPYKVALSAVMRMLLCRLESVAKDRRARRKAGQLPSPPSSLPPSPPAPPLPPVL